MWDKVKGVGAIALGIGVVVALTLLAMLMIRGGAWLGVKVFPFLQAATGITIVVAALVLLPWPCFARPEAFPPVG